MTSKEIDQVPMAFELIPTGLGFTDNLQPCYRKAENDNVCFGLVVQEQHANTMGNCHGGALMTLADIAAGSGVNMARGEKFGAPTINLSLDFISPARQGQWIQTEIEGVSLKRRFGFIHGVINNAKGVVARFNGTFYFPDHEGLWDEGKSRSCALSGFGE